MAEIAIPAVALGAMYILSNRNEKNEEKKEAFKSNRAINATTLNMGSVETGAPSETKINYPVQTFSDVGDSPASYPSPNAATDRYYQQEVYEKQVETPNDPTNMNMFKSLTGNVVQKKDIKFNNMVPYFGSTVKQRTVNHRGNESILDSYSGSGSQHIQKKEQAPLFAPQENLHYAHGTPSHTDFIQSRMNPSSKMDNTKPWEEIRVGPGLNKGFSDKGTSGFNAGMEARDKWIAKTVDQLRTTTNPKVTYSLGSHEGPANSTVKSRGFEGRVEKNRPDTYYINTPDRWFTTTGQEKAQRARGKMELREENRPFTTREYYGGGTANQNGGSGGARMEENYRKSSRPELASYDKYLGQAHNMSYKTGGDNIKENYGRDGYKSYSNARSTTQHSREFGVVSGLMKAVVAPVMDILRPSRKENVIGNMREQGNASGAYGVGQARIWNPNDRAKTTIKEQTSETHDVAHPHYKHDGGYATAKYDLKNQQRQTTNRPYTGNHAGSTYGAANGPVYNAAYNAQLNPYKEKLLETHPNIGNQKLFTGEQNVKISKIGAQNPSQGLVSMPKESANISTYGEMTGKNARDAAYNTSSRIDSNLLTAFNNNPYTKSLNSVA
jgi:hypothetical protein